MRVSRSAALLSTLLTGPAIVDAAGNFDCKQFRDDGVEWNLKKLGGPYTVHSLLKTNVGGTRNLTFEIDICKSLDRSGRPCPKGSRVCAFETIYDEGEKPGDKKPIDRWPVAGDYPLTNGRTLNASWKRLKDSDSNDDFQKEGVRVSLEGGMKGNGDNKMPQKAIIEFICKPNWSGTERPNNKNGRKRDNDGDQLPNPDRGQALQFVSYKPSHVDKEEVGILRLRWRTKFACEDSNNNGGNNGGNKGGNKGGNNGGNNGDSDEGDKSGSSWGFFTWFIIILFMAVAAYLIFGSWLNYNRYGARGWDLLPHGDTIRDVPYLLKEWGRKVVSGGVSRGGYNRI